MVQIAEKKSEVSYAEYPCINVVAPSAHFRRIANMFGIDVIEFGYQKLNVLPPKVTAGGPAVENESNSRRPNKNNASSSNKDRSCCAWTTSEKSIHISSADTRTFLGGSHRSHCNKLNMGDDTRDHDNHYCATGTVRLHCTFQVIQFHNIVRSGRCRY